MAVLAMRALLCFGYVAGLVIYPNYVAAVGHVLRELKAHHAFAATNINQRVAILYVQALGQQFQVIFVPPVFAGRAQVLFRMLFVV